MLSAKATRGAGQGGYERRVNVEEEAKIGGAQTRSGEPGAGMKSEGHGGRDEGGVVGLMVVLMESWPFD